MCGTSVDLAVGVRPEAVAQFAAEDLAAGVARDAVDELVAGGQLEVRELRDEEGVQVPGAGLLVRGRDDEGVHVLAPAFVGGADDDGLRDAGVAFQYVLDLGRVHVLAA